MTPNPSDRELNEVLARVAGVEIAEFRPGEWYCVANPADIASGSMRWNPLHDANQMEMAEQILVAGAYYFGSKYNPEGLGEWDAFIYRYCPIRICIEQSHTDKKRAFALAVHALEQSQKGTI